MTLNDKRMINIQDDEEKTDEQIQSIINAINGANKQGNKSAVQLAIDKINNRQPFTYDLNADALYQQYKDQYMTQGKQAMMDAMGQAAALTGGYGNSYAQTVGQQTYQGYLQGLNDRVPELYQLALAKYNQEGTDLMNQYAVAQDQYNNDRNYALDADKFAWQKSESDKDAQIAQLKDELENKSISYDDIVVDENGNVTNINIPGLNIPMFSDSEKSLGNRDWETVKDGGANWWGIDRNAVVKDKDGNEYKLKELKKALKAEGLSGKEAREYIKALQEKLGI